MKMFDFYNTLPLLDFYIPYGIQIIEFLIHPIWF